MIWLFIFSRVNSSSFFSKWQKIHVILRFDNVSFEYSHGKPILDEVSFSIRTGTKFTLVGQNGAGKSSLFRLIMGEFRPQGGHISIDRGAAVAIGRQTIPRDELNLSVEEFFARYYRGKEWDLTKHIRGVLDAVNLPMPPLDKKICEFSGGQRARILLASALIQNPDILLLDEPTNHINFRHLPVIAKALDEYKGAMILVSHVPDFISQIRIDEKLDLGKYDD